MDKDASQMDKVSYALCLRIGQQLKSMRVRELCVDDFAQGVRCVLEDKEPAMSHHDVQAVAIRYFWEKEAKGRLAKAEKSEKLFKENSRKEGVTVTASGLQYRGICAKAVAKPRGRRIRCVAITRVGTSTGLSSTATGNAASRQTFRWATTKVGRRTSSRHTAY